MYHHPLELDRRVFNPQLQSAEPAILASHCNHIVVSQAIHIGLPKIDHIVIALRQSCLGNTQAQQKGAHYS
jgi:hypothetical protein